MKPEQAIHSSAFPCNPVPFANRIAELCLGNTAAISGPEVRACLWVLIGQSYGQMATVDTVEEYRKLVREIPDPSKPPVWWPPMCGGEPDAEQD